MLTSGFQGPTANHKCSIHHWAQHGIAGRGVLLDYRGYAHKKGINYDPYDTYPISWEELYHCVEKERLKGLRFAEMFGELDKLHDEFDGGWEGKAMGHFATLV